MGCYCSEDCRVKPRSFSGAHPSLRRRIAYSFVALVVKAVMVQLHTGCPHTILATSWSKMSTMQAMEGDYRFPPLRTSAHPPYQPGALAGSDKHAPTTFATSRAAVRPSLMYNGGAQQTSWQGYESPSSPTRYSFASQPSTYAPHLTRAHTLDYHHLAVPSKMEHHVYSSPSARLCSSDTSATAPVQSGAPVRYRNSQVGADMTSPKRQQRPQVGGPQQPSRAHLGDRSRGARTGREGAIKVPGILLPKYQSVDNPSRSLKFK